MSSSNLVQVAYKRETSYGITPSAVAAEATLDLTGDIELTSVKKGAARNGSTFTLQVEAAAANPTDSILVVFTGTESAITVTVTPNDGTNNGSVSVDLTTEELVNVINTGTTSGKTITITDSSLLRQLQTATGGDSTPLANSGEGDGVSGTFSGGTGGFKTIRFTSEQYSGTPETTESAQIRTDRMSSGQVVTGVSVEGGHNFELAKEEAIEDFLVSAMHNEWVSSQPVTVNMSVNGTTNVITRDTGSFVDDGVTVGDFVKFSNFDNAANNVVAMVMEVAPTTLKLAVPSSLVTAGSESATFQVCDKLTIGTDKKSFSIEKSFLDLTEKAIIYRGSIVSQMELNVAYGALITGSFTTMGNDAEAVEAEEDFITHNEYVAPQATTTTMNGSVDMPFSATNVGGSWEQDSFCIQSLTLGLDNNLTAQNCIGNAAPVDYSSGTAAITVSLSSYLKDANWGLLAKKLSQEAFSLGFMVSNTGGWYGFYMPALQVSFDDPASGGANQEISMEMEGSCKVGSNGESALTIYREPA